MKYVFLMNVVPKELSLCHKFKCSNLDIFASWWCKSLLFLTYIIWSNSLKYVRSATFGFKDAANRESEFVAKIS